MSTPFMDALQHMLKVFFALLRLSTYNLGIYSTGILYSNFLPG